MFLNHSGVLPLQVLRLRIDPIIYRRQELGERKALGLAFSHCKMLLLCRVQESFLHSIPASLWEPIWHKSGCSPFCSWAALTISGDSIASCCEESAMLPWYNKLPSVTHYFEKLVTTSGERGPSNWIRHWYLSLSLRTDRGTKTDEERNKRE